MNDKALIESFNELFFLHIHIGGKSSSSRFVLPLTFSPGFCFYLTGFDSSTPESFLLSRGFAEVVTPSPSAFFFDFFTANGFGPLGPFATFFFFTTYLCSPLPSACSFLSSSSSSSSSSSLFLYKLPHRVPLFSPALNLPRSSLSLFSLVAPVIGPIIITLLLI